MAHRRSATPDGRPEHVVVLGAGVTGLYAGLVLARAGVLVTVTDSEGNPVSGATVTFVAPAVGPSAILSNGGIATTNAAGQASVTATANGIPGGPYVVTASVGALPAAEFSLTNLSSADMATIPALGDVGIAVFALLLAAAGALALRGQFKV